CDPVPVVVIGVCGEAVLCTDTDAVAPFCTTAVPVTTMTRSWMPLTEVPPSVAVIVMAVMTSPPHAGRRESAGQPTPTTPHNWFALNRKLLLDPTNACPFAIRYRLLPVPPRSVNAAFSSVTSAWV